VSVAIDNCADRRIARNNVLLRNGATMKPPNTLGGANEDNKTQNESYRVAACSGEFCGAHNDSNILENTTETTIAANIPFNSRIQNGLSVVISQENPQKTNTTRATQTVIRVLSTPQSVLIPNPKPTIAAAGA
jgi:hypothetical protein